MREVIIDGVTLKLEGGRVYWCDAWEQIDDLVKAGHLTRSHHGPATFGHIDYFIQA